MQIVIEQVEEIAIRYIKNGIDFSSHIFSPSKNIRKIVSDSLDEAIETAVEDMEEGLVYLNIILLKDGDRDAIVSQVYNVD